jgi:hypothetical protein
VNELLESPDLELQELHHAVAQVHSMMAESWFHEMALTDVGDHLEQLSRLLEEAGLGGA